MAEAAGQHGTGKRLGQLLVELGTFDEHDLAECSHNRIDPRWSTYARSEPVGAGMCTGRPAFRRAFEAFR
jgi:hypothetical protein